MSGIPRSHSGNAVVVVELGNEWTKIGLFEPERKGLALVKAEFLPADGSVDGKALGDALRKLGAAKHPVVAFIPRHAVTIRMLELPSTEPAEIADMVDLQIGKLTPYSKDEIASDYLMGKSAREGYSRVLLAIVQRSVLRQKFYCLDESGVDVDRMSVSSEGLINWSRAAVGTGGDEAVAVVDMDAGYTDFSVFVGGEMLSSRSIMVGSSHIEQDAAKWHDEFIQEIARSVDACQSEMGGTEVRQMVLTGQGLGHADLAGQLAQRLGIKVRVADAMALLTRNALAGSANNCSGVAGSMAAMVGTALAPENLAFNMIPDSVTVKKNLESKARGLTWFGIVIMMALFALSMFATSRFLMRRSVSRAAVARVAAQKADVAAVEQMQSVIRTVSERQNGKKAMLPMFLAVFRAVADQMFIETLEIDETTGKMQIGGTAAGRQDVSAMTKSLETSELFKDVRTEGTVAKDKDGRYKFLVVCALEREP